MSLSGFFKVSVRISYSCPALVIMMFSVVVVAAVIKCLNCVGIMFGWHAVHRLCGI